jgi:hypothetical protein
VLEGRAGGVVPTVDAVGVVGEEPYSRLIRLIERRPILPLELGEFR